MARADDEAVGKLVRNLRKHLGVIHGLVNCACELEAVDACRTRWLTSLSAIRRYTAPSHLTEMEKYDEMLATNSRGTFSFCQHFIKLALDENINRDPEFFPGGFAIVCATRLICSRLVLIRVAQQRVICSLPDRHEGGQRLCTHLVIRRRCGEDTDHARQQAASKAAVIAMSKSMAQEYASKDKGAIRVNVVAPGATEKPFVQKMFDVTRVPSVEQALADVPMGRHGDPEEVASAILFLLSPDAGYITVRNARSRMRPVPSLTLEAGRDAACGRWLVILTERV